jgi:MoaA/NifB/PqqE/SkfB family radical SAM enzyme
MIMPIDEPSLVAYQNQVEGMRKSPYLDFPVHVHLETNALCNAACNFCPYPTLER